MGVFGTRINMQFQEHIAGELIGGQHAFYGGLYKILGTAGTHIGKLDILFAADEAAVEHVFFTVFFFTRYTNLIGVDNNHMVTAISVRCINCLMTAAQHIGYFYRKTTEYLVRSVHYVPLLLFLFLCYCCVHLSKEKLRN